MNKMIYTEDDVISKKYIGECFEGTDKEMCVDYVFEEYVSPIFKLKLRSDFFNNKKDAPEFTVTLTFHDSVKPIMDSVMWRSGLTAFIQKHVELYGDVKYSYKSGLGAIISNKWDYVALAVFESVKDELIEKEDCCIELINGIHSDLDNWVKNDPNYCHGNVHQIKSAS